MARPLAKEAMNEPMERPALFPPVPPWSKALPTVTEGAAAVEAEEEDMLWGEDGGDSIARYRSHASVKDPWGKQR